MSNDGDGCIITRTWIIRGCGTLALTKDQTITVDCDFTFGDNFTSRVPKKHVSNFSINPNPGRNYVMVSWPEEMAEVQLFEVLDLTGRVVYVQRIQDPASSNSVEMNAESLDPGIYLMRLSGDSFQETKKWIKQ